MSVLMAWWEDDLSEDKSAVTSTSDSFWELVGYTKEEFGSKRTEWLKFMSSEDQERLKEVIKHEVWEIDFRLPQKDGTSIWIRETGRWLQAKNGQPEKVSAVVKNVTIEKKSLERMEARERESAKISREILELCPIAMALFQMKANGIKLLSINKAGIKLWHFASYQDAAENVTQVVSESIPPYQPNGTKSIPLLERLDSAMKEGNVEFKTILNIKGKEVNMKIHIKKIELPDKALAVVYMLPQ